MAKLPCIVVKQPNKQNSYHGEIVMKVQMKLVSAFVIALGVHSAAFAANTAQDKTDISAINAACTDDAKTAGCPGAVVGKGLVKCLDTYKKANKKSFHLSQGCDTALKQLHSDRKAGK